ncbi:MAG: hypothetical protein Fur002_22910 [Anaerolineales bacterium]
MKKILFALSLLLAACSLPAEDPTAAEVPLAVEESSPTEAPTTGISAPTIAAPASALPSGPLTMIALGDSLTQGDGDESGRGYTLRLLDLVNAIRPDSTITNLGQSGWNSDALIQGDQGLESQLTRAESELSGAAANGRAAVALVWIGSNDLWYLYEYGGDINDEGDAQDAEHFSANIDVILRRLRGAGAQVVIALLDDQSKRPIALRGEAFLEITPNELQRMSAQVGRYNEIIKSKAAQYGALTVDFYSTDIFTNSATLYDDGNHPNPAGYDVIAQKWFDALSPLLR